MLEGNIGASLALAFGVLCLATGAWHVHRSRRMLRSGVRASAVVVAIADPTEAAFPIVQFADTAGFVHRVELSFGDGSVAVGATFEVAYPPGQPEKACRVSATEPWFMPFGCLVVGVTALWVAARLAQVS